MSVTCSCRPSDIQGAHPAVTVDHYCDRALAETLMEEAKAMVGKGVEAEESGWTRSIGHASFVNATRQECEVCIDTFPGVHKIV